VRSTFWPRSTSTSVSLEGESPIASARSVGLPHLSASTSNRPFVGVKTGGLHNHGLLSRVVCRCHDHRTLARQLQYSRDGDTELMYFKSEARTGRAFDQWVRAAANNLTRRVR
jgi:hypothetical protein